MHHVGKMTVWVVIVFCATTQASLAIGPVDPDSNPPIMCVEDGICHVNGCQATPDPDCGTLPDNSSPDNSSPDNSSDTNEPTGVYDYTDRDLVKLRGDQVKFGDGTWVAGTVVGWGHVQWSVDDGFYTPRLIGYLHLDGASGKYARMHISYWYAGEHIDTRHGGTVRASDNHHHAWSVDLAPVNQVHITEAHVCTEISDDGDTFSQVACQTVYFD